VNLFLNHQRSAAVRISFCNNKVAAMMGDTVLAESHAALVVDEAGYPPRYYFPRLDVRMALLKGSDTSTTCPHKGRAEYFHLESNDETRTDVAWSYPAPLLSVAEISGYIAFYDEGNGISVG